MICKYINRNEKFDKNEYNNKNEKYKNKYI